MICYRIDLHRKFIHYMHGLLPPDQQKKLEDHLSKCAWCKKRIRQLQSLEGILVELPEQKPASDPWPNIEKRLGLTVRFSRAAIWQKAAAVAAFALISGLIGAVIYGKLLGHENFWKASFRSDEFKPVSINRMAETTEPHVVTEGYVTEARIEEDDGDRVFKLVEHLNSSGPFVICEVIEPLDVPIPPIGSRVRVYGVSRFDAKSDHNWHEVHPVLNIEILNN